MAVGNREWERRASRQPSFALLAAEDPSGRQVGESKIYDDIMRVLITRGCGFVGRQVTRSG